MVCRLFSRHSAWTNSDLLSIVYLEMNYKVFVEENVIVVCNISTDVFNA